jgi:hypothetical protein
MLTGRSLQRTDPEPDRIVVMTRALNSDLSDAYIAEVRSLLFRVLD